MAHKNDKNPDKVERPEEQLFDKRLVARNITKGLVSRQDLDKRLSGLTDLEDRADNIAQVVWGNHAG